MVTRFEQGIRQEKQKLNITDLWAINKIKSRAHTRLTDADRNYISAILTKKKIKCCDLGGYFFFDERTGYKKFNQDCRKVWRCLDLEQWKLALDYLSEMVEENA